MHKFLANFNFTEDEISFVRRSLCFSCKDGSYDYLREINCSNVEVHIVIEGSIVFSKVPLLRIEGLIVGNFICDSYQSCVICEYYQLSFIVYL